MTLPCALKTLFFSVLLFFYQQGLANDTYELEEFRQFQKRISKSPANIRIGFVRLNLESDEVSGDNRLEVCENYEVSEPAFTALISFYFDYANMGGHQDLKARIQRAMRLLHRMFGINVSQFNRQSPDHQQAIYVMAKSLFEQRFFSANTNGRKNPYFHYFTLVSEVSQSNLPGVNNGLVLMFLTFLGPHFLSGNDFENYSSVLRNSYTRKSYERALSRSLLSRSISEYSSPQNVANQLFEAGLDTETALLIGLNAMASAAFMCVNLNQEWPETLEALLQQYLPYEILGTIYWNLAGLCPAGHSCSAPQVMYTVAGMQEFTQGILSIDLAPAPALSQTVSSESLDRLSDYFGDTDTEEPLDIGPEYDVIEADREPQDPHAVIQQQNELIAQLRQNLANQAVTEEAGAAGGAIGGATGGAIECPICLEPPKEMTVLRPCGHAGLCKNCAERCMLEQLQCPLCRGALESFEMIFLVSPY